MAEKDQVRPLAPASLRFSSVNDDDVDEEALSGKLKLRRRQYIKCCGCFAALILILAVTLIVLSFTVFHIRDPRMKINQVTVTQLPGILTGNLSSNVNMTLIAAVSVKNPNFVSLKFQDILNSTVLYKGMAVGVGKIPRGISRARKTLRMNITVDIIPRRVVAVPGFLTDMASQKITMSSFTSVGGNVKIMKIIKRYVVVNMNCTMTYDISSRTTHEDMCTTHIKI